MEAVAIDQQVAIINNSIEEFKAAPQIVTNHRDRASKALAVASAIEKQWQDADAIQDPTQRNTAWAACDERSNKFLANCSKALAEMKESRKGITQLMDMLKKMFTEEENKLDPKAQAIAAIQGKRNAYAQHLLQEQERKRKEAERKAAIEKERVTVRAELTKLISNALLAKIADKKGRMMAGFNGITLENFTEKSAALKAAVCIMTAEDMKAVASSAVGSTRIPHSFLDAEEYQGICTQAIADHNYTAFYSEYHGQISELKQSLIDKLPSKKEELEKLATADANERIRLENERLNREAEEKRRLEAEAEAQRKKAEEDAELQKAAGTAAALFDQATETAISTPAPQVRSSYDIEVNHPAGWVEIFQFWYQREGCKMAPMDMGKKNLTQMKTFAEGEAKKNDEKIDSKYLVYKSVVKSVNKK